jgi:nitrilase
MASFSKPFVASVVQIAPVMLDKVRTLEKVDALVGQAMKDRPSLILFPEVTIPGYPRGLSFGTVVGNRTQQGRELWQLYYENAVKVPGPETGKLGAMAKRASAWLVIGVTEQDDRNGSLYCTLLYFRPDGTLAGKHRKIKPTAAERILWAEGDGSDLNVYQTEIGRIGGLICWENYMPGARMKMYEQGVEVYLAPTADCRESWQSSMIHIACEGRCYVLGCNQIITKSQYSSALQAELAAMPEMMSNGGSVIISPLGRVLAGPHWDREGVISAQLDPGEIVRSKMDFDVIGHYARPDLFSTT